MKKLFLAAFSALSFLSAVAQDPMIVVFPDDSWMDRNQFGQEMMVQGVNQFVSDYATALRKSDEMKDIITRFGKLFKTQGFEITPLQTALQDAGIDNAINFSQDLDQSPADAIIGAISPDIRLNLDYNIQSMGFNKKVDINLFAVAPYNNSQIAATSFTSEPTKFLDLKGEVETMLQGDFDNFMTELKDYYADKKLNGQKLTVKFQTTSTATHKLTDMVDGKPLRTHLINHLKSIAKNNKIGTPQNTPTMLTVRNVRWDKELSAMDLQDQLVEYLNSIGVPAYADNLRLGTIQILIGEQ